MFLRSFFIGAIALQTISSTFASENSSDFDLLKDRVGYDNTGVRDDYLSYQEFTDLMKSQKITHEQADELIRYAHEYCNPIIFKMPENTVPYSDYCLNFLWIHAKKNNYSKAQHMFGDDDTKLEQEILDPIKDWHSKQPGVNINFWYDDQMLEYSAENIENTKRYLSNAGVKFDAINFVSIRNIEKVKGNAVLFNDKRTIFFRVDFAKVLIADHIMEEFKYAITVDSDVTAIKREQLFDKATVDELDNMGYVFGSHSLAPQENSFVMLGKDKAKDLHVKFMIEKSISRAYKSLSDNKDDSLSHSYVFDNYSMFKNVLSHTATNDLKYQRQHIHGKPMIFPDSQQGSNAYSMEDIAILKKKLY